MIRLATTGSFCLLSLLGLCGCSSFFTARAIDAFTSGLAAGDLDDLKQATSTEFEQKALRLSDSLTALKILPLPAESGTIVEIEEPSPDERIITLAVGEAKSPIKYRLKRETEGEGKSREWVVDDVILMQNRPGRDTPLTKSVTEQMDVLLTVQEFLTSWREGSREDVQATLHPTLQAKLASVSPVHLAQITNQVLDGVSADSFTPEAHIQPDRAAVFLPRRSGQLVVELQRLNGTTGDWRVSEVAVRERKESKPSVSIVQLAELIGTASDFVRAYDASDRDALSRLASDEFYKQALLAADLTAAPLPADELLATRFEIAEGESRSDVLFDLGARTCLVSVVRDAAPAAVKPGTETPPALRVQEVTIYERDGSQIKPLSSVLTAQAVVEVFAEALATRDAVLLKQLSTADFNQRVWSRLASPELLETMPLDIVPAAPPRVVTTIFQGPVTEITVTQGNRAMTYVLHAGRGRPQVEDVLIPSNNRPSSLKTMLESLAPIHNFALAWDQRRKETLEASSSDSLRRMIWMQSREVPDIHVKLSPYVQTGLKSVAESGSDRIVTLGDAARGAVVRLVPQGRGYAVEDVRLLGAEFGEGKLEFIAALREQVSQQSGIVQGVRPRALQPMPRPKRTPAEPERHAALPAAESALGGTAPAKTPLLLQSVAIPGA